MSRGCEEAYDGGRPIGKGSFGSVFLVKRRCDGKEFVMKKMPIGNVSAKEQHAYEMEVRLLSQLVRQYVCMHACMRMYVCVYVCVSV